MRKIENYISLFYINEGKFKFLKIIRNLFENHPKIIYNAHCTLRKMNNIFYQILIQDLL